MHAFIHTGKVVFCISPPVTCIIYVITFLFVLTTTRSMILLGKVNSSTLLTHCLCILMHIHTVYKRFTFLYVFFFGFYRSFINIIPLVGNVVLPSGF